LGLIIPLWVLGHCLMITELMTSYRVAFEVISFCVLITKPLQLTLLVYSSFYSFYPPFV
jgi:hypothetical protein